MSVNVTIIYTPAEPVDVRNVAGISRLFFPDGSYVDTPVYVGGLNTDATVGGTAVGYGKSIYATNVAGWGKCFGLIPMASTTTKFAEFQRAIFKAIEQKEAGEDPTGITFAIDGYTEELYWNQMGANMVDQGFFTQVGDNTYGVDPRPADGGEG